jgi:hypothetical protein
MGVDMKKYISIALMAVALMVAGSTPSYAFHGGHGGGHVGGGAWGEHGGGRGGWGHGGWGHGGWWGGGWWGPGWWGVDYYPYYPYYDEPPVVIQPPSDTYNQPTPQAEEPNYWYFCQASKAYYPYVSTCPSGWVKVVPSPPPGE